MVEECTRGLEGPGMVVGWSRTILEEVLADLRFRGLRQQPTSGISCLSPQSIQQH